MGEDEKLFDSAAWEYFLAFSREISEERERIKPKQTRGEFMFGK